MKVLLIQDYLRPGGTERQTALLARSLRECGSDVALLTFRPGGTLSAYLQGGEIVHRSLQRRDFGCAFFAPGLLKAVERSEANVVLCMGRTANCYAGFIQGRFPQLPVVASVRTGKSLTPLHRWSLKRVSAILVNSAWWQEKLIERGFDSGKIELIYNALRLSPRPGDGKRSRLEVRERFGASRRTCVFLCVAEFRPGKRQDRLIETLARLPPERDWQLWFVGAGAEQRKCSRLARQLDVANRVHFLGYQSDVWRFYEAADVAVSASVEDSLPNALIEAQAAGLPVVAVDTKGVGESFEPGRSGILVAPDDRDSFLEGVARLAGEPELRRSYGKRAARFAAGRFSKGAQVDKVHAFLESVAAGRAARRKPMLSGWVFRLSGWRRLVFWPLYGLIRVYLHTLRFAISDEEERRLGSDGEAMLVIGWHNRSLVYTEILRRFRRPNRICCLISPSRWAAWEDALFEAMHFRCIRGSSSRRSIAATRELLANHRDGMDIGITPDGPSGPLYEFKRGALFMARKTDAPILLFSAGSKRAWRLGSWDRHFLPHPFATVRVRCSLLPRYSDLDCRTEAQLATRLQTELMAITED